MIDPSHTALLSLAVSLAAVHTLIGVDHYLPFVVLGRARGWSLRKVAGVAALCGLGHVVGSVLLGFIGIGIGAAVGELEIIESVRGSLAAWGLIGFGLIYMAIALRRLVRNTRHAHVHAHDDGSVHHHDHDHHREHLHAHEAPGLTFWGVFIVFALGPCEPLIPVLMAPAFEHDWWLVAEVAALFSITTIGMMVTLAVAGAWGLSMARMDGIERYGDMLAGGAIAGSGLAIQWFGI